MPLDSRVWVTLADLKEHLDISDTDKDSFLTNILNAAWEMAKNYIGYDLNDTVYTEDYDGDGTNELLLKKWPIISITSIKDDTDRTFGSDTVIDSTDYLFDADTGLVTLFQGQGVFTSGRGNIRVVYTAGYTSIPYDAQRGLRRFQRQSHPEQRGRQRQRQRYLYQGARRALRQQQCNCGQSYSRYYL